jgi:hypothetical protein
MRVLAVGVISPVIDTGDRVCAGAVTRGQLGDGANLSRDSARLVTGVLWSLPAVSCLRARARRRCWGDNTGGQIGPLAMGDMAHTALTSPISTT